MSVSETRKMQALALELSAELSEAADALSQAALKANISSNDLLDVIFQIVNELREKLSAEFTESRTTGYEVNE
jgi:hypothetical protein